MWSKIDLRGQISVEITSYVKNYGYYDPYSFISMNDSFLKREILLRKRVWHVWVIIKDKWIHKLILAAFFFPPRENILKSGNCFYF